MKYSVFICILFLVSQYAVQAQHVVSFAELRQMMDQGMTLVDEDMMIDGLIITDTDDHNIEQSQQAMCNYAKTDPNLRTMYIQSYDGRYGFRLYFDSTRSGRLPRYSHAVLNLRGTQLQKADGGYSIMGLADSSKVSVTPGKPEDRVLKECTLDSLTDEDLYTFVTLKNMEFVFKDGSYSNINEVYSKSSPVNKDYLWANGAMDSWATLACDQSGRPFYLMINSRTPWRRDGKGVQQGAGDISGVLVSVKQPRYGDCLGKWQLRPLEKEDIGIAWKASSSFKPLVEWIWEDGEKEFFTENGPVEIAGSEIIYPDRGKGELWTDVVGKVIRGHEPNNVKMERKGDSGFKGEKGYVDNGAFTVRTEACNWWDWETDTPKSIYLSFSTSKISGSNLIFAFSFAGGFGGANSSYGFPVYWKVECSLDEGKTFQQVGAKEYQMHSLPWYWENDVQGVQYSTCWRAGQGFTEHVLHLPAEAFGQKKVIVRISPARKNIATLAEDEYDRMAARPSNKSLSTVNFGSFVVRYN